MIETNAVKELNLVVAVIHEVRIEDRIKGRPPEHAIGLDVVISDIANHCIRFRIHPLFCCDIRLFFIQWNKEARDTANSDTSGSDSSMQPSLPPSWWGFASNYSSESDRFIHMTT